MRSLHIQRWVDGIYLTMSYLKDKFIKFVPNDVSLCTLVYEVLIVSCILFKVAQLSSQIKLEVTY